MPELRKHPLLDLWIVVAEERSQRPQAAPRRPTLDDISYCPFCPGHEAATPPEIYRVGGADEWRVRVVPNRYPALRVEEIPRRHYHGKDDLYQTHTGIGAHEVIIESRAHDEHLAHLGVDAIADVLRAYRARFRDLSNDSRLASIQLFKNHGALSGSTLVHPHSQLIATPFVPGMLRSQLAHADAWNSSHGSCLFCDIVNEELRYQRRLVYEDGAVVAFAPFASRFPFEVWLLPKTHAARFEESDDALLVALAKGLNDVLGRLYIELNDPPFNMVLHTTPPNRDGSESFHWRVEVCPRLTHEYGGLEVGSGYHVNPTPPETAAAYLTQIDLNRL